MLITVSYFPLPKCYNFSEQFRKGFLRQARSGRSWLSIGHLDNVYSKLMLWFSRRKEMQGNCSNPVLDSLVFVKYWRNSHQRGFFSFCISQIRKEKELWTAHKRKPLGTAQGLRLPALQFVEWTAPNASVPGVIHHSSTKRPKGCARHTSRRERAIKA